MGLVGRGPGAIPSFIYSLQTCPLNQVLFQVLEVCSAWLGLFAPGSISLLPFFSSTAYGGREEGE